MSETGSQTEPSTFDVIVIGAGAVGEVLAGRTAAAGLTTLLIENELVGGECSYWACMPSKALLRPMAVLNAAKRVPAAAGSIGSVDAALALKQRDETVSGFDDAGQVEWVKNANVELVRGTGRLDGPKQVVVEREGGVTSYSARTAVVVATGSHAAMPLIPGLDTVDAWDSRGATSVKAIPRRLAIIGGGTVAVEMAQAFRSLGCEEVVLLVRDERLIANQEPFASEELAQAMASDGIDLRMSTEVKSARKADNGSTELSLSDGRVCATDQVLVAAGRKPTTDHVGLETVGLEPGKSIVVNDQLRAEGVDGEWLYAVGDVNGRALLTHMGKYQARLASDAIAGKSVEAWSDHHAVPGVTFTDPQIASVGMRLSEAREAGLNVKELKVPLSSAAGAYVAGNLQGTAQLVVDEDRKVIVGATFTGPEVGEMLHSATIAIVGEVPLERLWHAVPSYPTVSEVWLRLLEQYGF